MILAEELSMLQSERDIIKLHIVFLERVRQIQEKLEEFIQALNKEK